MNAQLQKELKQEELKLLSLFDLFCEQNGLKYFLAYGTLLGAIRHNGFIPWDDDVDIIMPREDYDLLLSCLYKKLPKEVYLQSFNTEKNYKLYISKLRLLGSKFEEEQISHLDIVHGAYIDIFVYDSVPKGKISQFFMQMKNRWYISQMRFFFKGESTKKSFLGKFLFSLYAKFPPNYDVIRKKWEKLISKYKNSSTEMVYNFSGDGLHEVMPAAIYRDAVKIKFEDLSLNAPIGYIQYLECIYGDYLRLPPEEQRINHGMVKM